MTIAAILKHKTRQFGEQPLATCGPADRMVEVDDAHKLLGIVSERDIVRCIATHGAAALEQTAGQLMTREVRTAPPSMVVSRAMEVMSEGRFRHLPVVDEGRLVGIVSIGDVVTARLRDAAQEVDTLKAYVAG
jgi:CBS domain-containing protein